MKSKSSVQRYIDDLVKGCRCVFFYRYILRESCSQFDSLPRFTRCVELDIWDGPEGDPIVWHGGTLTSKIQFYDVITAINEYAFVASPYPVILSLENHCSVPQQIKMAQCMVRTFGDALATPCLAKDGQLPSPEALRGKILIKGKPEYGGSDIGADIGADGGHGEHSQGWDLYGWRHDDADV